MGNDGVEYQSSQSVLINNDKISDCKFSKFDLSLVKIVRNFLFYSSPFVYGSVALDQSLN